MKKVLVPRVRFKGFDEEWSEERISNILTYVQPWKYLTKKKNFDMLGNIPVLTANKSLLLGYSVEDNYYNKECIIFDDFTQDFKYINYPFLLKSSVIKILIPNNNYSISFIFFLFQSLRFESQGHARHYISYVQKKLIRLPSTNEANKIIKLLDQISNLINLENSKLNKLKQLKQTLLQKMFPEGNSKTPKIRFKGFEGEWKEERLENITKRMSSGGTPSTTIKKFYNGKIPFLTISDMTKVGKYINNTEKNITPEAIENSSTWLVPKNSLLLSMYASFGKTAINKKEITTSQAILGIILNNNISVEFLYYLLFLMDINQYWYKQVETGTQPNLSNWTVSKTLIKLTKNISEQQKIGDFFSKIDTIINLYNSKLNKLKQIKEALLQKMFV
ncbi:restriction endonuclease subunit S [Mycoplasmopsis felis]|uniref:restriction endonuclease subunit S n=1 Tax=Mycoplasmopsis felis TaxID=33923 RepID=UPI002AFE9EA8|nr:restriction endonuclease subunit S [Mycoplasmopsis felis]WQQ03026.1 restriction endonuclease subunit S [Mycoplasmopsis felis]